MHVLLVHTIQQHESYNALDVDAWEFYVLPRSTLIGLNVDSLTLSTVARLTNPIEYGGLAAEIRNVAAPVIPRYWRKETGSSLTYFKLVGSNECVLRDDSWEIYDHYKLGPTWWNITGEIGTDIIDQDDLPSNAPR